MLKTLEQYQPAVIGLDLYRGVPQAPGHAALQSQLRSPHVIAITKPSAAESALFSIGVPCFGSCQNGANGYGLASGQG